MDQEAEFAAVFASVVHDNPPYWKVRLLRRLLVSDREEAIRIAYARAMAKGVRAAQARLASDPTFMATFVAAASSGSELPRPLLSLDDMGLNRADFGDFSEWMMASEVAGVGFGLGWFGLIRYRIAGLA